MRRKALAKLAKEGKIGVRPIYSLRLRLPLCCLIQERHHRLITPNACVSIEASCHTYPWRNVSPCIQQCGSDLSSDCSLHMHLV
jgi:hypothetical protein